MVTVQQWFARYEKHHKNKANKLIHWICIPLIMFSLLGLLFEVRLPFVPQYLGNLLNCAFLLIIITTIFYYRLSFKLMVGMVLVATIMLLVLFLLKNLVAIALWKISLVIFVLAWIGQFIGHKMEGQKPSFFEDLLFLLIGPLWLLGYVYRYLKISY